MGTVDQLIDLAESQVGTTSGKKYWDWYWDGSWTYVDGYTTPYCACFVSWCLAQAGVKCDCFPSAVAFDWRDGSNALVDKQDLKRGDPVAFDWDGDLGGDHVGIVTGVYEWGITTVEGNTNGGVVAACQRPWSVVICGLRPDFDEGEEVTEEDKRDIARYCAEYVYGEEDRAKNLNMYNQSRWGFEYSEKNNKLLNEEDERISAIEAKLKAHSSLLESIVDAVKRVENVIMSVAKKLGA